MVEGVDEGHLLASLRCTRAIQVLSGTIINSLKDASSAFTAMNKNQDIVDTFGFETCQSLDCVRG